MFKNDLKLIYIHLYPNYRQKLEQLIQKQEKRNRSATYIATQDYSGHWFPIFSQGFRVCISFPLSDEPRISVTTGDYILVTRWKNHWLYGEKLKTSGQQRERGWFPKRVAVQIYIPKHNTNHEMNNSTDNTSTDNNCDHNFCINNSEDKKTN